MSLPWIFLSVISALVLHWPTWLALIVAQIVTLIWAPNEMPWLPGILLVVSFLVSVVWPLLYD